MDADDFFFVVMPCIVAALIVALAAMLYLKQPTEILRVNTGYAEIIKRDTYTDMSIIDGAIFPDEKYLVKVRYKDYETRSFYVNTFYGSEIYDATENAEELVVTLREYRTKLDTGGETNIELIEKTVDGKYIVR